MSEKSEQLKKHLDKLAQYRHVMSQLSWDFYTQTPKKGVGYKIDAITYFSGEVFKMQTSEELGELYEQLSQPEEFDALDDAMKLTVKRGKREYERNKRVPADFYQELVKESRISEKAWEEARENADYAMFCPHLQKMIDMKSRLAKYMEPDKEVYDTMLDMYEEGVDSALIDRLFTELKEALVPLFKKIMEKPEPDETVLFGRFDVNSQKELGNFLLSYIGFDMEAGAIGESAHPFTMGFGPGDVRITNHYKTNEAVHAMFSTIHEGGHAIFEQGIDKAYEKTSAAQVDFLGLHESQSRFYENILGRNINFWKPIYDKVGEFLPRFQDVPLEHFYKIINHVRPSLIRIQADELTYCFHIILRYEIEKAIFRDGAKAEELPSLWNDKMEEMLGIRPSNDAEGILQDTHWSDGSFGYFPTYLLGTIYDGMFLEEMEKDLGSLNTVLAEGRVSEITAWLHDKIHRYGSMRNSPETIKAVCGQEITAAPVIRYFTEKYTGIYGMADYAAGVILPDGEYVLTDNHLETLLELSGQPKELLWDMIPKEDSALFWMIAYTGCVITDYNSSVGMEMTKQQEKTFRAMVNHGVLLDKYYDITNERKKVAEENGEV